MTHPLVNLERIGIAMEQAIAPGLLGIRIQSLPNYNVTMLILNGKLQSLSLEWKVDPKSPSLIEEIENWGIAHTQSLFMTEFSHVYGVNAAGKKVRILVDHEDDTVQTCFTHISDFADFAATRKQAYAEAVAMERNAREIGRIEFEGRE